MATERNAGARRATRGLGLSARLVGETHDSGHRNLEMNSARAAVLGAGDGLITNVSLILGVAGASSAGGAVRLAGVAGLLAGAFSMAAGELVSVRAQDELVAREIEVESAELADAPESEQRELAAMYRARGVPRDDAETVARILSANHDLALDTHSRLELGIDPDARGSAGRASLASFCAFAIGAFLPLIPWLVGHGTGAIVASLLIGAVAAFTLGVLIATFTDRSRLRTGLRQLVAAAIAAGVTYAVGRAIGVHAS